LVNNARYIVSLSFYNILTSKPDKIDIKRKQIEPIYPNILSIAKSNLEPTWEILSKSQLDFMYDEIYTPLLEKQMEEWGHTFLLLFYEEQPPILPPAK